MRNLLRLAAFRALAPDEGAGDGGAAPAEPSISDLADAAYDTVNDDALVIDDEATDEGADAAPDDEPDPKSEDEGVADAPKPEDDAVRSDDEPATKGIPAEIVEKYPAIAAYDQFERGIQDPATVADTVRALLTNLAAHHGMEVSSLVGLAPVRDEAGRFAPKSPGTETSADGPLSAPKDFRTAGFASQAEYDAAPEYERAGFASQGEYLLARQIDALNERLAPVARAQEAAAKASEESSRAARWSEAVAKATPSATAIVKAETGWTPTPEQVLDAAREYPEIAARSLSKAVQAAHVKEILAHGSQKAKGTREKPLDMPQGGQQPGRRAISEADRTDPQKLADWAYEDVA